KLFKDLASYRASGGPVNSGGVYDSRKETFLVPFESIGLKPLGTSFVKSEDFDSSTMVHELTHQMMHFWLDFLPLWVAEGTAEYTSNLPLHAGRFRVAGAKTGLKDYLDNFQKRSAAGGPGVFSTAKRVNM